MSSAPRRLLFLLAATGCTRAVAAPAPSHDDRLALRHVIDSLLASPETRSARWGVLIVDPEAGDTLYSHDAGKLMVPASNQKILTSAFALDALGPAYQFETPIIARGPVRDGVLDGDLLIVGRGDPSISDHMAGDAMIPFETVAESLSARGIRRIRGSLVAYGDAFPDANIGWAWEHDDLATTSGAAVDELLFNEGFSRVLVRAGASPGDTALASTAPAATFPRLRVQAVTTMRGTGRDSLPQLTVVKDTLRGDVVVSGSIPVGDSATLVVTHGDPAQAYLAALRESLEERGIIVDDSVVPPAEPGDTVFVLRSPPLSQILAAFLKPSQNQIGEMLFKSVALAQTDTGTARTACALGARSPMASWCGTAAACPDRTWCRPRRWSGYSTSCVAGRTSRPTMTPSR